MTAAAETPVRFPRRAAAKARTRERILTAARTLFKHYPYADVTIRGVAATAGMSTGAIFATVKDKADLWRAAMECEPPLDRAETRAAPLMLDALRGLIRVRPRDWNEGDDPEFTAAWAAAEAALALAEGQNAADDQQKAA
ncbi:helix-turn-helix domain-containing protein [Brevundimonas sp.]|uniref:TetR/AcrR family transcriptional regulator n=1 Tax=Brevundimonas sp. TaxID=1871086 RepID=UPI00289A6957|nr:helix-turn-helix domain-containing protein [Brevundimonas sp.]